ncbi:UDP-glycosyltransferase UGT5-like [Daphnia carinata]|uniref:UDP-glycosyltransferase UGT5-like n=1 Tax=Daphnia carinata TaxID=120202 RepID=UPI002579C3B5|nr:UDP-glycosyltransferase UGT5-like [Daphnia carinata]
MRTFCISEYVILLLVVTSYIEGYNILILAPITSPSHSIVFKPLVEGLVESGHFVTYWNGLQPSKSSFSNRTKKDHLRLLKSPNLVKMNSQHEISFSDRDSPFTLLFRLPRILMTYCKAVYEDPVFHQLMHSKERYDLIIVDGFANECTLYLAEALDVPFVYLSCLAPQPWLLYQIGSPLALEQFPNPAGHRDRMNLGQRLFNSLTSVGGLYLHRWLILPLIENVASQTLGINNLTSIVEIENRYLSLLLVNSHFSVNYHLPTASAVVEVGGIHVSGKRQLPKLSTELASFLDNSGDAGFIVISFGSMLRGDELPNEFRRIFMSTFARLKQRVVWKWENESRFDEDGEPIPKNIKTISWLPQQALLMHPKIRLFISHGGLLSQFETVYHGVPSICLPVWADHPINAQKSEDDGYAIRINWDDLTEEKFYNAIQLMLTNPSYSQRVKQVSALMHDQIDNPLDRAIFWIEYVIRHRGAPHLRNASRELALPQRALLDVFLILMVAILLAAYLALRLGWFWCSKYSLKNFVIGTNKKEN